MPDACTFFNCYHAFGPNQQTLFLFYLVGVILGDWVMETPVICSLLNQLKHFMVYALSRLHVEIAIVLLLPWKGKCRGWLLLLLSSSFGGSDKPYAHLFSLYFDKDFMFVLFP